MKIDFNEQGMSIQFDKVPKLLYFNEERAGCGKLFLNGVQRKGLVDVKIHAHTADEKAKPRVELEFKYLDMETGATTTDSNIKEGPDNE